MLPINTATAEAVRDAIALTDWTEKSVAEGANFTPSTWRRRMRGRTAFTVGELTRICAVLGMRIGALFAAIAEKLR